MTDTTPADGGSRDERDARDSARDSARDTARDTDDYPELAPEAAGEVAARLADLEINFPNRAENRICR